MRLISSKDALSQRDLSSCLVTAADIRDGFARQQDLAFLTELLRLIVPMPHGCELVAVIENSDMIHTLDDASLEFHFISSITSDEARRSCMIGTHPIRELFARKPEDGTWEQVFRDLIAEDFPAHRAVRLKAAEDLNTAAMHEHNRLEDFIKASKMVNGTDHESDP